MEEIWNKIKYFLYWLTCSCLILFACFFSLAVLYGYVQTQINGNDYTETTCHFQSYNWSTHSCENDTNDGLKCNYDIWIYFTYKIDKVTLESELILRNMLITGNISTYLQNVYSATNDHVCYYLNSDMHIVKFAIDRINIGNIILLILGIISVAGVCLTMNTCICIYCLRYNLRNKKYFSCEGETKDSDIQMEVMDEGWGRDYPRTMHCAEPEPIFVQSEFVFVEQKDTKISF